MNRRTCFSTEIHALFFDDVITGARAEGEPVNDIGNTVVKRLKAAIAIEALVKQTIVLAKAAKRLGGCPVFPAVPVGLFVFSVRGIGAEAELILVPFLGGGNVDGSQECFAVAPGEGESGGGAAHPSGVGRGICREGLNGGAQGQRRDGWNG